ncbi:unnamed protein product [Moneuplotes crassus]|uniref:Uncharacterized protein n=1 Tax=Euplotes crassus TaxID=5936 RepID=A0AAD1UDK7_EUPCR|nr:unnamed protein product [Moneuplotes crassus]
MINRRIYPFITKNLGANYKVRASREAPRLYQTRTNEPIKDMIYFPAQKKPIRGPVKPVTKNRNFKRLRKHKTVARIQSKNLNKSDVIIRNNKHFKKINAADLELDPDKTLSRRAFSNPRNDVRLKRRKNSKVFSAYAKPKNTNKSSKRKLSPKQPDLSQYDYRRNKCHLLLSSGLREAKLFEDKQSGEITMKNTKNTSYLQKIFTPSVEEKEIPQDEEFSQISVGELEDDCIIEDDESTLNQCESKAFEICKGKVNQIQRFRPSTAVVREPKPRAQQSKRERPMTSNKYKKAYATLLAKTKCSSEFEFKDFMNDPAPMSKELNEEDEIIMMKSAYNSLVSIPTQLKFRSTTKASSIRERAMSVVKNRVSQEDETGRRVSKIIKNDQLSIKRENKKILKEMIEKCNIDKEDLFKRKRKLKFKRYGLFKKFRQECGF